MHPGNKDLSVRQRPLLPGRVEAMVDAMSFRPPLSVTGLYEGSSIKDVQHIFRGRAPVNFGVGRPASTRALTTRYCLPARRPIFGPLLNLVNGPPLPFRTSFVDDSLGAPRLLPSGVLTWLTSLLLTGTS